MVTISITDINGKVHTLQVKEDSNKSIVELAAEEGIELPYSCMSGACFACCGEVSEGEEYLNKEKVGEQLIDVDNDEVLCCIAGVKAEAFDGNDKKVSIQMMN